MMSLVRAALYAGVAGALLTGCSAHQSLPHAPPLQSALQSEHSETAAAGKTMLLLAGGDGVHVFDQRGRPVEVYATSTGAIDAVLDDKGTTYVLYVKGGIPHVVSYAIGSPSPGAAYEPSQQNTGGVLFASHAGELVYAYFHAVGSKLTSVYDVWDPGASNSPSRTFTHATPGATELFAGIAPDGTLYIPYYDSATQTQRYDVIPPKHKKPSKTIVDTLVTGSAAESFSPNAIAVAGDGTLYVGEWSFAQGDPLAGLYVYSGGGEMLVQNGATNPTGLGIDAAGDVYVLNSNEAFASGGETCDTLHTLTEFAAQGGSILNQAAAGFTNGQWLTIAVNGTSYIGEAAYSPTQGCSAPQGIGAIGRVRAGRTSAKTLIASQVNEGVTIYNGKRAINPDSQAL